MPPRWYRILTKFVVLLLLLAVLMGIVTTFHAFLITGTAAMANLIIVNWFSNSRN